MMKWLSNSIESAPSFDVYKQHITTILDSVYSNPVLTIELCKTLIEGVCKKILADKGETSPDSFPKLISLTVRKLNLEHHQDAIHLKELSRRLVGILHYLGEIRNQCNFASHGQDRNFPTLSSDLALFVVNTTNAILGFILHFYIITGDYREGTRINYDDFKEFNDFLDNQYPIKLGEISLSYSEALFQQDIEAYKEWFNEYKELEWEMRAETL